MSTINKQKHNDTSKTKNKEKKKTTKQKQKFLSFNLQHLVFYCALPNHTHTIQNIVEFFARRKKIK